MKWWDWMPWSSFFECWLLSFFTLLFHFHSKEHTPQSSGLYFWNAIMVQLSHPYMTTGKKIALTRWTFVGKVMSLPFIMLSMLVIAFLPRNKSLNFMIAVTICSDSGVPPNKASHCFHCFPIYLPWSDETGCPSLSFLNVEFYANSSQQTSKMREDQPDHSTSGSQFPHPNKFQSTCLKQISINIV